MSRRPWDLTARDEEVLLEDEHRMLRWLCAFDYPMTGKDMANRLPRWPGRTLEALLGQGLVRRVLDVERRAMVTVRVSDGTPARRPSPVLTDGYEPTGDGRDLAVVLRVMTS